MRRRPVLPGGALRVVVLTSTVLFVAAGLVVGVASFRRDFALSARQRGESVYSADFRRQVRYVTDRTPPRAGILLVATPQDTWRARLWQRALYPRNDVIVRLQPFAPDSELRPLRVHHSVTFAITLGDPSVDLPLRWNEDLGRMFREEPRVRFGALEP